MQLVWKMTKNLLTEASQYKLFWTCHWRGKRTKNPRLE